MTVREFFDRLIYSEPDDNIIVLDKKDVILTHDAAADRNIVDTFIDFNQEGITRLYLVVE